jgi:Ni/Co efflux regulator RcnB
MKKIMLSVVAAAVMCAGTSFAQGQKSNTAAPVQNVAGAISTSETNTTTKKDAKATAPAKKEAAAKK